MAGTTAVKDGDALPAGGGGDGGGIMLPAGAGLEVDGGGVPAVPAAATLMVSF